MSLCACEAVWRSEGEQAAAPGFQISAPTAASSFAFRSVMRVSVEGPTEFQGAIYKSLMQRRGNVLGSTEDAGFARVDAEVPLAEMFGYSTDLRSATEGKAEFTMEFAKYSPAPSEVTEELMKKYKSKMTEEDVS